MNTTKTSLILAILTGFSFAAHAYDSTLAKHILTTVTGQMDAKFLGSGSICKKPVEVLGMLKKNEKLVLLDVRTPEEHGLVALNHPNTVFIPLNELFKKENLDRLPQDGKIIVICHSASRSAGAVMLLKAIGFKDVYYVLGGFVSLINDLTPKTVASQ